MIVPELAAVRPRFVHPDTSDALLVEDEIRARLEIGRPGLIALVGPPGAGKSTAIAHLAHVFAASAELLLADHPPAVELQQLIKAADRRLVVLASPETAPPDWGEQWRISPWTNDECIEYLLRRHPDRCRSTMCRLEAAVDRKLPRGCAELWAPILDCLAADDQLTSLQTALRQAVHLQIRSARARNAAREYCFLAICTPDQLDDDLARLQSFPREVAGVGVLRHDETQLLLAAEHLAAYLFVAPVPHLLDERMPESVVLATAALVRDNTQVLTRLRKLARGRQPAPQAMAASLLHATGHDFRPRRWSAPMLSGAYLARVKWPDVQLKSVDWSSADLSHADLRRAQIKGAFAFRADFTGARLAGAELQLFHAVEATFVGADLAMVRANHADFRSADLRRARLENAVLADANCAAADLSGARCARADLARVILTDANIEATDFTGANLSGADLRGLTLREANFAAAQLACALLDGCDLEYMRIPAANFEYARLPGAYLTGSQMPRARFRGANLRGTGLAEIDWEQADLRGADLRHCTFHLGSSRSGLVGSPIASEGSRTGFYTDEYHEQEFKAPEEIRKANLRGADLRGAQLEGVDFYLVDLRDALYTPEQEEHFHRCRAILEDRAR